MMNHKVVVNFILMQEHRKNKTHVTFNTDLKNSFLFNKGILNLHAKHDFATNALVFMSLIFIFVFVESECQAQYTTFVFIPI